MFKQLRGQQIIIRPLRNSDAKSIKDNISAEVVRFTTLPYPYKLSGAYNFIKKANQKIAQKEALELGIEHKKDKKIIGIIGLIKIDLKNKNGELGYWLGRNYWGQGIGQEAVKLILNYAFNKLKLHRVSARVVSGNSASIKLLKKSGFNYEGRFRQTILKNRRWYDQLVYSLLKPEFTRLQKKIPYDEKSCGVIVFRLAKQQLKYLIIQNRFNRLWGFPKGHMEKGETEQQAALRELYEEVAIRAELIPGFRQSIYFQLGGQRKKLVVFFVGRYNSGKIRFIDMENSNYAWLSLKQALKKFKFNNIKQLLIRADKFIQSYLKKHA